MWEQERRRERRRPKLPVSEGRSGRWREECGKMFQDDGRKGGGEEAEWSCDPLIWTKTRSLHSWPPLFQVQLVLRPPVWETFTPPSLPFVLGLRSFSSVCLSSNAALLETSSAQTDFQFDLDLVWMAIMSLSGGSELQQNLPITGMERTPPVDGFNDRPARSTLNPMLQDGGATVDI